MELISEAAQHARNYFDRLLGLGAVRSVTPLVPQPELGLRPDGRLRSRLAGCGRSRVTRTYLNASAAESDASRNSDRSWFMNDSNRRVVRFLQKEIKTYVALSLFLTKKGTKQHVHLGATVVLINPLFYKERMKEAKKLVNELRNAN
jgi:hypothetical protein